MPDPISAARQAALVALSDALAAAEQEAATTRASREDLLDARRRLDVLRRQQQALLARADHPVAERAALIGHRQPWAATRLVGALERTGLQVVETLDNAADLVGAAAAVQPRLVVVEDRLPMMRAEDLVQQARALAPRSQLVVLVEDDAAAGALTAAGAAAVVTRRAPVEEVAAAATALLSRPDEPAQSVD